MLLLLSQIYIFIASIIVTFFPFRSLPLYLYSSFFIVPSPFSSETARRNE